jgi:putative membrane protein
MGLANLVPGISGGTMLLASGVYRAFVNAVADITSLRWSMQAFVTLIIIGAGAGAAIVLGAGLIGDLVETSRWGTFSVFLGLTLGGIPLLWSLVRPWKLSSIIGCLVAIVAMAVLALSTSTGTGTDEGQWMMLALAGLLGGAAMVLPGLSGAYLLLILGQYVVILAAIDLLRSGDDLSGAVQVLIPVGIGAAVGIAGVSNLMTWVLKQYPHGTHGVLLGLLIGAVFGLWPFMAAHAPEVGDIIRGSAVTQAMVDAASIKPKYWPLEAFSPATGQILAAIGLVMVGFAASAAIGQLGKTSTAASADGP